jgi:CDP-diacylglycerol--serine O-phosphatidyltransferase
MSIYQKIPNTLTLGNLLLGCLSIVYLFYDHITIRAIALTGFEESGVFDGQAVDLHFRFGKMHIAAMLIMVATVTDFLDGWTARLFNASSELGKQLDSLADLVTFGVAPGLILYYLTAVSSFGSQVAFEIGIWAFVPAFLYTLAAAYRLARFNTHPAMAGFSGLPTPAAALFVAGLALVVYTNEGHAQDYLNNSWWWYGITVALSALMVSRLPLLSLKFSSSDKAGNKKRIILVSSAVIIMIALFLATGWVFALLPALIVWYILVSLTFHFTNRS